MRAKSMVLIFIALGCGLVASIAISQVLERGANTNQPAFETVQIYVATSDIDVNEQLTAQNVRVEDWPKSKVPEGAIRDLDQISDRFARVRFYEGEPILKAKLAEEIEGAAVKIPDGHRVCSLKVQMDTAVSGLVKPGDRVDIFGYFKKGCDVPTTGTRQILRNVRVFAVNSQTDQETDQDGRTIVAKTVSVLVQHDQVARLMLATELGTLRLALRRPNETTDDTTGESATIESLFGMPADTADESQQIAARLNAPRSDTSPASGFVGFLSGLANRGGPSAGTPAVEPTVVFEAPRTATRPEWEMVVLTPQGGTNFTWTDARGLPSTGERAQSAQGAALPAAVQPNTPPGDNDHQEAGQGETGEPSNETQREVAASGQGAAPRALAHE